MRIDLSTIELWVNDETGALEQLSCDIVDHDGWYPVTESYVLYFDRPASHGTPEHREAILPYVQALVWFFSQAPDDIPF